MKNNTTLKKINQVTTPAPSNSQGNYSKNTFKMYPYKLKFNVR